MLSISSLSRPGLGPIDLDLAGGQCLALSGPSGAGKTLFLRAVADLDPHQGRVNLDGEDSAAVAAPEWRRRVAFLAAEAGWWEDAVAAHFPDREAAMALFPVLGLEAAAIDWSVARLSTGERQRLALARVLLLAPRVMLLDEPTAALDEESTLLVEAELRRRLAAGTALLMVTHDPRQAERMAARRLYLAGGAIGETRP